MRGRTVTVGTDSAGRSITHDCSRTSGPDERSDCGMDQDYQPFCMADPSFYDAMHSEDTAGESFATAARPLPDGWTLHEQDDWFVVNPRVRQELPPQGWKIHASADHGQRGPGARRGLGLLRRPRHLVQVPAVQLRAARPRLQVRPARLRRQARHDLPRRRRGVRADPHRARRAARRRAEPVHPQRPALGPGPAVRPVRRVRQPVHGGQHGCGGRGDRRPGRQPRRRTGATRCSTCRRG